MAKTGHITQRADKFAKAVVERRRKAMPAQMPMTDMPPPPGTPLAVSLAQVKAARDRIHAMRKG